MKSIIIIGAHCPDEEREKLLYQCVESVQGLKNDFDVMVSSHTHIPEYISNLVDYVFYDKNNELITDHDYLNKPWFSPLDNITINSSLVTNYSTYLAAYRIFIGSLGLSKVMGYKKVHWIEYDSNIKDYSEIYDNEKLINDYSAIQYKKEYRNYEDNLEWGYGCFQAINIEKIEKHLLFYDKKYLLEMLSKSNHKTNEKITQDLYTMNGGLVLFKNFDILTYSENKFNLSTKTEKDSLDYWAVPFFDTLDESVKFVVWNNKDIGNINVIVIVNDNEIFNFFNISKYKWEIKKIGELTEINSITTIINGKIKNRLIFDDAFRNKFHKISFADYT